jgi:hypothetical protein
MGGPEFKPQYGQEKEEKEKKKKMQDNIPHNDWHGPNTQ